MVLGQTCWHADYMRVTRCSCDNWDFEICTCQRVMSGLSWFIFIFCPMICIAMMVSGMYTFIIL